MPLDEASPTQPASARRRLGRVSARLVRSRIARNVSATMYLQVVQLAIQFASVPILSIRWGLHDYGIWLILFTFPSYIAMADLGFGTAASSDMTMRVARGDRVGAAATFLALKLVIAAMAAAILAVAAAIVFLAAPHATDFADAATGGHAKLAALAFIAYGIAGLASGAVGGGYRAADRFALGGYVYVSMVLIEGAVALGIVLAGGGLLAAALAYLSVRTLGTLGFSLVLRRAAPWLYSRDVGAALARVRPLLEPALSALVLPAAQALSIQGGVLVIGSAIGAVAVPPFTTIRTLTRTALQLTMMVNLSVLPAFSVAAATGDERRKAQMVLVSLATSAAILPLAAPAMILLGRPIIQFWTHGHVSPPIGLLIAMTAAMLMNGFWSPLANLILGINKHGGFTYFYLAVSAAMILLAYVLAGPLGLTGVGLAIAAIDAVMLAWVVRLARRLGVLNVDLLRRTVREAVAGLRGGASGDPRLS